MPGRNEGEKHKTSQHHQQYLAVSAALLRFSGSDACKRALKHNAKSLIHNKATVPICPSYDAGA
jgi:hypothetical protein